MSGVGDAANPISPVRETATTDAPGNGLAHKRPVLGTSGSWQRRGRRVSIDSATAAVMRRHRESQEEERLIAGGSWMEDDYVFRMGLGSPLFPDTVTALR
jgi:hypothetical protein